MSIIILLFLIATIFQNETTGCFLYDIDYKGTNLNDEHTLRTEDAATCQKMCQNEPNCYFWTWATPDFHDVNYRKDCYLKAKLSSMWQIVCNKTQVMVLFQRDM